VLLFVYMVLAAQYESFIIPLAVVLSLPAGVFGSFQLLEWMGLANDIYAQVGLIMLVGLLGKNAVLIVEFAAQKHQQGMSVLEAAIEGAKVRFRPILMTSFAFIAGLVPLVVATGPGAVGNRTIGASALGGMLYGTVFGVVIVPGLYFLFGKDGPSAPCVSRHCTGASSPGRRSSLERPTPRFPRATSTSPETPPTRPRWSGASSSTPSSGR